MEHHIVIIHNKQFHLQIVIIHNCRLNHLIINYKIIESYTFKMKFYYNIKISTIFKFIDGLINKYGKINIDNNTINNINSVKFSKQSII